ncbi:gamma-glutamyl peptidase 3 isoform X2 [Amborella trichopoda]|uniref:gamma-glutamyl peptidase 3 isoform X2 n=1 Tax=Amborella trichopoda TaxID=13333 RepID=UPI0009BDA8FE|nr:gamma-glutamyl peptidase 3 isoform X2 [Amborella trichopoda]|eukprot:XP_020526756.1 gamma-glutamyl peptidase 3 isoform X2 [Amborella trichopoda]
MVVGRMFDPSPRKFALLVTGVLNPQFTSRYGTITLIFERFLKEAGEVWDSFLVVNGDFSFMDGIDDYSGFVVTGSQFDAHANDPWILQLCQALKHLHHMKKKILGICFGHQVLARAFGGSTGRDPSGWDIGLSTINLDTKRIKELFGLDVTSQVKVIEIHQDQVKCLPPDALILGSSRKTGVEMFSIGNHILGSVCKGNHREP